MESKLKVLNKNVEMIVANSGDYKLVENDQLLGGILNAIWSNAVLLINKSKTTIDKLEKWTTF